MAFHVLFWQLDANGEHANGEDNTGDLECNLVADILVPVCPCSRIEQVTTVGTYHDAEQESPYSFADIELTVWLDCMLEKTWV
jgi:hypothetical protein